MAETDKAKGKEAEPRPKFSIFHFPPLTASSLTLPKRINRINTAEPEPEPIAAHYSTPHPSSPTAELTRAFASARVAQPTCHTCGIEFTSPHEQREHFKTAEHNANVQRKVGLQQNDAESKDVVEAVQNADSDEEDVEHTPYLWFTENEGEGKVTAYGVHRRILVARGTHNVHVDAAQVCGQLRQMQLPAAIEQGKSKPKRRSKTEPEQAKPTTPVLDEQSSLWAVLAQTGGHFAGAIFDNRSGSVIAHKTLQRYTTRRKQGGLQSRQDASGRAANSAGAQIRRHNERRLQEDMHAIIEQWRPLLAKCERVFVRVAREGRRAFFAPEGVRAAVAWGDASVRPVPVPMGRPSLTEVRRVYRDMTRVRIAQFDLRVAQADAAEPDISIDEEDEDSGSSSDNTLEPEPRPDLIAFVYDVAQRMMDSAQSDAEIAAHLQTHTETLLDAFSDAAVGLRYLDGCPNVKAHRTPTLLHVAAMQGRHELIALLLDCGEDPTITNGHYPLYAGGETAYQVARDRTTRDAFRTYRYAHQNDMDAIEWDLARVPDALSPSQQHESEARARDKKKRERTRRKQRERAQKEKQAEKQSVQQSDSGEEEMLDKIIAEKEAREQKLTLRNRVKNMTPQEIQERMRSMATGTNTKAKPVLSPEAQRAADRELRFQAAQRRLAPQSAQRSTDVRTQTAQHSTDVCTHCGVSLHGRVPFEQFDWKCCSVQCLHGQQLVYGTNI
ncbi:hypothetical protein GGH96_005677 [Coemansia sp. RSA 1972]|nr:hypothetical protein GGH96_005677 [Coemansia sp. RSA 1972]